MPDLSTVGEHIVPHPRNDTVRCRLIPPDPDRITRRNENGRVVVFPNAWLCQLQVRRSTVGQEQQNQWDDTSKALDVMLFITAAFDGDWVDVIQARTPHADAFEAMAGAHALFQRWTDEHGELVIRAHNERGGE
jgi:hypothetical protein